MEKPLILVDTSILIDFYRKTKKENTVWLQLLREGYSFAISVITKYEIFSGATESQLSFWNQVLPLIQVIPLDELAVDKAADINAQLKRKNKQIEIADLFIAATAVAHQLKIATLNIKHFDRVENLEIVNLKA